MHIMNFNHFHLLPSLVLPFSSSTEKIPFSQQIPSSFHVGGTHPTGFQQSDLRSFTVDGQLTSVYITEESDTSFPKNVLLATARVRT